MSAPPAPPSPRAVHFVSALEEISPIWAWRPLYPRIQAWNPRTTMAERWVEVAKWSELSDRKPAYALCAGVDLVVVRYDNKASVLYGRCHHRGALLSDGCIKGPNLICGVHGWDYRYESGVSEYENSERLKRFSCKVDAEKDALLVDEAEVEAWAHENPQPYLRDQYLGTYNDVHGGPEETQNGYIRSLAQNGLSGHHGPMDAMGVPRPELPAWSDIQILTGQLAKLPLLESEDVATELVIGPMAQKPLALKIPIFVSDMSYGALSEEAKTALAKGAEQAGTGICSGEGGMLPEEQQANSRYFYELASAQFGWSLDHVEKVQAFHFKGGQGAKTGTGGHLPGEKVIGKIAEVRGLQPGQPAVSPPRFLELTEPKHYRHIADQVRERSGGIPVGFKLSAQHVEADIDFALAVDVDYIILDGRGGGTGAAPKIFRDNISVPTIAALARARKHLNNQKRNDITLIVTGGLRTESDFVKAMAMGADGVAIANSALQAIGCLGMRACHTNNCPVGIATQKPNLRARLEVEKSAKMLARYLDSTVTLMKVLARACGHNRLADFRVDDLTTWKRDVAYLAGVPYAGVVPL